MVKLQGTTTRNLDYFILPAEPWVRNGLEAFVSLRQDTGMTLADAEYNRRNLATMMRRLEQSVAAFVDRKVPKLPDGNRWLPAKTFAQILLARAYLRGETRADAPLLDQIRAVLSDEGASDTDFSARSMPWQEWLNATKGFHERLRLELRAMVSLHLADAGTGTGGGSALVDASELAAAIVQFNESGKFDPVPEENGGLPDLYRKARELAQHWTEKRLQIDRTEFNQIKSRSESVCDLLRGKDTSTHVARLDRCITGIAEQLPGAAIAKVQAWKQNFVRLGPKFDEGAGSRIEELIVAIEDEDAPTKLMPRLTWMAQQPVRDLEELLTILQAGERAIEELRDHARDCVREGGSGSLDDVQAVGLALRSAVDDFEIEE